MYSMGKSKLLQIMAQWQENETIITNNPQISYVKETVNEKIVRL